MDAVNQYIGKFVTYVEEQDKKVGNREINSKTYKSEQTKAQNVINSTLAPATTILKDQVKHINKGTKEFIEKNQGMETALEKIIDVTKLVGESVDLLINADKEIVTANEFNNQYTNIITELKEHTDYFKAIGKLRYK